MHAGGKIHLKATDPIAYPSAEYGRGTGPWLATSPIKSRTRSARCACITHRLPQKAGAWSSATRDAR